MPVMYRISLADLAAGALILSACTLSLAQFLGDDTANIARSARSALATEWRAGSDLVAKTAELLPPITLPVRAVVDRDASAAAHKWPQKH